MSGRQSVARTMSVPKNLTIEAWKRLGKTTEGVEVKKVSAGLLDASAVGRIDGGSQALPCFSA